MGGHTESVQVPESKLTPIKKETETGGRKRKEEKKSIACSVPVNKGKLKITFSEVHP